MSGYQFVHIESYARKPNPRGQSVAFIFAEAMRRPGACGHVAAPRPPMLVFGRALEAVAALHDARAAAAKVRDPLAGMSIEHLQALHRLALAATEGEQPK